MTNPAIIPIRVVRGNGRNDREWQFADLNEFDRAFSFFWKKFRERHPKSPLTSGELQNQLIELFLSQDWEIPADHAGRVHDFVLPDDFVGHPNGPTFRLYRNVTEQQALSLSV
jgi:hypothetical protein